MAGSSKFKVAPAHARALGKFLREHNTQSIVKSKTESNCLVFPLHYLLVY